MTELTEAQLYNLHSVGCHHNDEEVSYTIKKVIALHLYLEHDMKVREIAKKTGLKMKEVKEIISQKEQ